MNFIVWGKGDLPDFLAKLYKTEGVEIRTVAEGDMPARAHRFWCKNEGSWVHDYRNVPEDLTVERKLSDELEDAPEVADWFEYKKIKPQRSAPWQSKTVVPTISVVGGLGAPVVEDLVTLKELQRRYVAHVYKAVDGNRSRMARILGLDRRTIYRMPGALDGDLAATNEAPPVEPMTDAAWSTRLDRELEQDPSPLQRDDTSPRGVDDTVGGKTYISQALAERGGVERYSFDREEYPSIIGMATPIPTIWERTDPMSGEVPAGISPCQQQPGCMGHPGERNNACVRCQTDRYRIRMLDLLDRQAKLDKEGL